MLVLRDDDYNDNGLFFQVVLCDIWRCGPGYGLGVRLYNDCSSRNVRVDFRGRVLANDETSNALREYLCNVFRFTLSGSIATLNRTIKQNKQLKVDGFTHYYNSGVTR